MQLILIALIWSAMVACSGVTVKTHGSDVVERELSSTSQFEDCINEFGEFDEDIGHDTLDCGNL